MNIRNNDGEKHPSTNKNTTTQPPRQKVCLDLDENIVSILHKPDMRSHLSTSAEQCIDSSKQLPLKVSSLHDLTHALDESEDHEIVVRVVNLQEWKSFFEKTVAVNKRYQQLAPDDKHQLIHLSILTSASYTFEAFTNNVFKIFFGEQLTLEIFREKNNSFMNIHTQMIFQAEDDKGLCLDALYTRVWTRKPTADIPNIKFIPDLVREHVWLIDDQQRHCKRACDFGFSAIHNSTSLSGREATMFYTNHKADVFKKIHAIVEKAERYCDELAATIGQDPERTSRTERGHDL